MMISSTGCASFHGHDQHAFSRWCHTPRKAPAAACRQTSRSLARQQMGVTGTEKLHASCRDVQGPTTQANHMTSQPGRHIHTKHTSAWQYRSFSVGLLFWFGIVLSKPFPESVLGEETHSLYTPCTWSALFSYQPTARRRWI